MNDTELLIWENYRSQQKKTKKDGGRANVKEKKDEKILFWEKNGSQHRKKKRWWVKQTKRR